ncbi:MAG TPA: SDR family NAD(P)-dependent oxidoreductase, partial [Bacteroidales bacterium]|nr:SDR family NAD(P)-dependent oxidoreductase [Bacteroidales bacterium]
MGLLKGKIALVTGASRGIGKAIAIKFAGEGADIAFTARSESKHFLDTVAQVTALGVRCKGYTSDASDFKQTHELVEQVMADFGRIDILVNNAGVTRDGLLMRMSEEQWDEILSVNLKSAFNFTH